ncbi:MAG: hypothetical protein GF335_02020 [Candidatus Moranbacteria bacterium]|nr:hypothetical protein [Candidatus Moranbacteria bacterium]
MNKSISIILIIALFFLVIINIFDIPIPFFSDNSDNDQQYLNQKAQELKKADRLSQKKHSFCNNSYFPLPLNSIWSYKMFTNDQKEFLEMTVVEGLNGQKIMKFNLIAQDWIIQNKVQCKHNGLIVDNINFLFGNKKVNTISTPLDIEGIFLPKNFEKNKFWNFKMKVKNEIMDPQKPGKIIDSFEEEININFKFLQEEEIDILYNNQWTKKINSDWKIKRINPQPPINEELCQETLCEHEKKISCDLWLADQIGIVKTFCVIKEKDNQYTTSLELKGLKIPSLN